MIENGVIDNMWRKYKAAQPKVIIYESQFMYHVDLKRIFKDCLGSGLDALGMENVLGIFMCMFAAIVISLIIFIFCFIL